MQQQHVEVTVCKQSDQNGCCIRSQVIFNPVNLQRGFGVQSPGLSSLSTLMNKCRDRNSLHLYPDDMMQNT